MIKQIKIIAAAFDWLWLGLAAYCTMFICAFVWAIYCLYASYPWYLLVIVLAAVIIAAMAILHVQESDYVS